jgi:hypothetical protein
MIELVGINLRIKLGELIIHICGLSIVLNVIVTVP